MKVSNTKYLLIAALVLFALFQIGSACCGCLAGLPQGTDLQMRRNEIICAHQGINSFRIWNRELTVPGFVPWGRPDKEKIQYKEGDAKVHAYPAWHTTMFWFYGWITKDRCIALMSLIFGACLFFIVHESLRLAKERFKPYILVSAFALLLVAYNITSCFFMLNYGVLILTMFFLMKRALEKDYNILAGVAWAIMMIKPQEGLLFFWPLFWGKRYVTIITAVVICLAATFTTSLFVHESVIDLILQVPEIGRPYGSGIVMSRFIRPLMGESVFILLPAFFFVFVGFGTWLLRKSDDFLIRCAPVAFAVPLWTYSSGAASVNLLPVFILLIGRALTLHKLDTLTLLGCLYFFFMICMHGFYVPVAMGLYGTAGNGWIWYLFVYICYALLFAMSVEFLRIYRRGLIRS